MLSVFNSPHFICRPSSLWVIASVWVKNYATIFKLLSSVTFCFTCLSELWNGRRRKGICSLPYLILEDEVHTWSYNIERTITFTSNFRWNLGRWLIVGMHFRQMYASVGKNPVLVRNWCWRSLASYLVTEKNRMNLQMFQMFVLKQDRYLGKGLELLDEVVAIFMRYRSLLQDGRKKMCDLQMT